METIDETRGKPAATESKPAKLFLLWLYPALWLALLVLLSTEFGSSRSTRGVLFQTLGFLWPGVHGLPSAQKDLIEFGLRKTAHFTGYAVFAALLFRAFYGSGAALRNAGLGSWIVAALVAALDEYHQSLVPSRTSDPKDVLIDIAGATSAVSLCLWVAGKRKTKRDGDVA